MSEPQRSPLASLVLFMFCLAIAGSALAGAHYYAVDLPAQNAIKAPANGPLSMQCWDDYQDCIQPCIPMNDNENRACFAACELIKNVCMEAAIAIEG